MAPPNTTTAAIASASDTLGSPLVPSPRGAMRVPKAKNQTPKGGHEAPIRRTTPRAGRRPRPGRRHHRSQLSAEGGLDKWARQVEGSRPGRPSLMGSGDEPKTQDPGGQHARPRRPSHPRPASCLGPKRSTRWRCGHPSGTPTAGDRACALTPNDLSDSKASRKGGKLNPATSSSGRSPGNVSGGKVQVFSSVIDRQTRVNHTRQRRCQMNSH